MIQLLNHHQDKRQALVEKFLNNPTAFIQFANNISNVYKNIDEYNPEKVQKIISIVNDTIKMSTEVTESFICDKNLNISD